MRDDAEGRRRLERYVKAAQAVSEAIGRGRVLEPGQPLQIAEVWNEEYLAEMRRLEAEEEEARREWYEWMGVPSGRADA